MVDFVKGHSYEDAAKLMEIRFPSAKYSASQLHTQVKLAKGSVPPREMVLPHLAGTALPPSIISQYSGSSSDHSWPVDTGLEEVDDYSQMDWVNPMNDPTDAFQYVIPNSFISASPRIEDPPTMMFEAMKEVVNAIPRIGINSMKNRMLNDVWRKFNPDPAPPQQPQDNAKSDEDIKGLLAKYEEFEKREKARQVLKEQKKEEERAKHHENIDKLLDTLRKKVESLPDKKTVPETIDPLATLNEKPPSIITQPSLPNGKILDTDNSQESVDSAEPPGNPGKESLQEKASSSQERNPPHDSNGVGALPPPAPDVGDKQKQPGEEEKHFTGIVGNGNQAGPRLPSADGEGMNTGQADPSAISQRSESGFTASSKPSMTTAPSTPPPPPTSPKGEDQKSNGRPADQSSVQGIFQAAPAKPEVTLLKSQPSVNHNLRNQALTGLVVVGIGIAALYIFNPQVRQWVFSQYVRIFHRASPQSTSDGTSTQPQQNSNASRHGYARVNDPNGVAFF
jgi:hypothetical protein